MEEKNKFQLEKVSVRLVSDAPMYSDTPIATPEDAVSIVGETLCEMDREVMCIINLRTDMRPINCTFASVGTVASTLVHPREMLKASILSNTSAIIMVHNHPAGTLIPSKDDVSTTDRMQQVCELMGISLLDHIIVGRDNRNYFSFKEKSVIKNHSPCYQDNYQQLRWESPAVAEKGRGGR